MRKGARPEPEKIPAYVRQVVEELQQELVGRFASQER
jgi:hypothetical protein